MMIVCFSGGVVGAGARPSGGGGGGNGGGPPAQQLLPDHVNEHMKVPDKMVGLSKLPFLSSKVCIYLCADEKLYAKFTITSFLRRGGWRGRTATLLS